MSVFSFFTSDAKSEELNKKNKNKVRFFFMVTSTESRMKKFRKSLVGVNFSKDSN